MINLANNGFYHCDFVCLYNLSIIFGFLSINEARQKDATPKSSQKNG